MYIFTDPLAKNNTIALKRYCTRVFIQHPSILSIHVTGNDVGNFNYSNKPELMIRHCQIIICPNITMTRRSVARMNASITSRMLTLSIYGILVNMTQCQIVLR
jgi:hypothetical protein